MSYRDKEMIKKDNLAYWWNILPPKYQKEIREIAIVVGDSPENVLEWILDEAISHLE